jgi:two-component system chemotaxis response regulator CheY
VSSPYILAVDDSASQRQMLAHVLTGAGYRVMEAEDGEQALDHAHRRRFDAVLTDHNMPKMDGLALVARLRALEGYATTPILVLTTENSGDLRRKGREAGATGWMTKPFDPEVLLGVFVKLLG